MESLDNLIAKLDSGAALSADERQTLLAHLPRKTWRIKLGFYVMAIATPVAGLFLITEGRNYALNPFILLDLVLMGGATAGLYFASARYERSLNVLCD